MRAFAEDEAEVLLLEELTRIAAEAVELKQAALDCLQACSDALGAASGFVALASTDDAFDERLEIAALVGPHAPLLGDATRVAVNEQAEVAVVYTTGEPHFVGSVYDSSDDPSDGTARWRGLISAQATAVLPLGTSTRRFGVMMLEWSQVTHFGNDLERLLQAAARITALAVERLWDDVAEVVPSQPDGPPAIAGRNPLPATENLEPGVVPVVPATVSAERQLRFELTAEGLVRPKLDDEPWGPGRVQITLPPAQQPGLLLDVHAVGSGRVFVAVCSISGVPTPRQAELVEMLRHTTRVLAGRSTAVAVLETASERVREFGGATASLEGWVGVFDATTGSLMHEQSGHAGSRMLMADGRNSEGSSEAPSTWLPLAGDILHAWVPGLASVRAEWH